MFTKQFKCTLLSDVILNQKSASEGPNKTLDFIPGNNLLGITAAHYNEFSLDEAFEAFHSGRVRFGDAHPAGENGYRSLRASASFFYPKLGTERKTLYNFHLIQDPSAEQWKALQLKQFRTGFYNYYSNRIEKCEVDSDFSLKSEYNREHRRSEDGAIFGYEALRKGLSLYFEVASDSEPILEKICQFLVGQKRIGRSRSAQYGLIDICECPFLQVESSEQPFADGLFTVFADGRLIFLDEFGIPTFKPTAADLGFTGDAEIEWDRSQIKTFQYAPYNGRRNNFDVDRCGIEKGSVFVVKADSTPTSSAYIGYYQNEGFGKVIYNPEFLSVPSLDIDSDKPSSISLTNRQEIVINASDSPLIMFLKEKSIQEYVSSLIYDKVNAWVEENRKYFFDDLFASQWGSIRAIAMHNRRYDDLMNALFSEDKKHPGFLAHGVAETKWKERRRRDLLKSFITERHEDTCGYEWQTVVNLASVMAKLSRK